MMMDTISAVGTIVSLGGAIYSFTKASSYQSQQNEGITSVKEGRTEELAKHWLLLAGSMVALPVGILFLTPLAWLAAGAIVYAGFNIHQEEESQPARDKKEREAQRVTPDHYKQIYSLLKVPPAFQMEVVNAVQNSPVSGDMTELALAINTLAKSLPPFNNIIQPTLKQKYTWGSYMHRQHSDSFQQEMNWAAGRLPKVLLKQLEDISFSVVQEKAVIPEPLRSAHMHILAGSGHGKTQLIQEMILRDLQSNNSIVLIDSQGDMIEKLLNVVPPDRLIHIDPRDTDYTPAIEMFSGGGSEQAEATAVELYQFMFSALDASLTSKMSTVYRYVCRLLMVVPSANIYTLKEVLEPGGMSNYSQYLGHLSPTTRSFFEKEYDSRQYTETKQHILRRLYAVMESPTFERLFSVTETKIDVGKALDSGKVILIDTAKDVLKETGCSLFGRFWIAQVAQAVFARTNRRHRTYLYLDEAQDYLSDDPIITSLFEQARKRELGLIIAHQYLDQLPPKLAASISANTAIKFAGGLSAKDNRAMAAQMRVKPEQLDNLPIGTFVGTFKGSNPVVYEVAIGALENKVKRTQGELVSLREDQRQKYRVAYRTDTNSAPVEEDRPRFQPKQSDPGGPQRDKW